MSTLYKTTDNKLLAALRDDSLQRLSPHLQAVTLRPGEPLYEPGIASSHVYFPARAIVSLMYVLADDTSAEIAIIGCEGVVGAGLVLGGESPGSRAVVQAGAEAFRLPTEIAQKEFRRGEVFHDVLLRYVLAQFRQVAQRAICNRYHSVQQQLCRWLLLIADRLSCDTITMTQELIASTMGVRRMSIAEAAKHLADAGLIRYSRGHIELLDRAGLEACVCECYWAITREYERLAVNS